MTKNEYNELQDLFSKKLFPHNYTTKREEAYNNAILACKSILKKFYEYNNKQEEKNND